MALALIAAMPAFAASGTSTAQVEATLEHQGFPAAQASAVAHAATQGYHGTALAQLAQGLRRLPALPKTDYRDATLKSGAAAAYAKVLTEAFTRTASPAEVTGACHAFTKAVGTGTDPLETARLVVQGLAGGLRGKALADLADHYAQRVGRGIPDKVAYGQALAAARVSPMGQPTGLNPTAGAMGANVNGMGAAAGGGVTGAMGMGAGGGVGPGGAMAGGGTMTGGGGTMGGGGMGHP